MSRRKMIKYLALSLFSLLLLTGCRSQIGPEQFSVALLRKLDQIQSYQLEFALESAGQTLIVRQWYQAPDRLRTDVLEDGHATFRFFRDQQQLRVDHLPSGQQQLVALTAGNELFLSPLLLDCCRQAAHAAWRQAPGEGAYVSDFVWTAAGNLQRKGSLTVDAGSLLPRKFELIWSDQESVRIRLQEVLLNPELDENLFSEIGR